MVGSTYYNIARETSNIFLNDFDFTEGSIVSFAVTGATSTTIQDTTTYKIDLRPEHSIPTNSVIEITFPSTITLTAGACSIGSTSGGISNLAGCSVSNNVITLTNPFGTGTYTAGNTMSFVLSPGGKNPLTV